MAGHRDDGTYAGDNAHHPNRRPENHRRRPDDTPPNSVRRPKSPYDDPTPPMGMARPMPPEGEELSEEDKAHNEYWNDHYKHHSLGYPAEEFRHKGYPEAFFEEK